MSSNEVRMVKQANILLLDCNPTSNLGSALACILKSCPKPTIHLIQESIEICETAISDTNLYNIVSRRSPDAIFIVLPPLLINKADSVVQSIRTDRGPPIIVVLEEGDPDHLLEVLRLGAADFVTHPVRATDVIPRLWRLLDHSHRNEILTRALKERLGLKLLVGESPVFLAEIDKIPLVAKCDARVLISGETGTGKELVARAVHYLSPRASKPFIPVNCGAIPTELLENELFGHERGAFTGASARQSGLLQEANGGSLLLDEIDCLSLTSQVKLLRFLQESEYRPLGSSRIRKADIRIIAATNVDLEDAVKNGAFRKDLYYRLNIMSFILPPLRERSEDIPLLSQYFLAKYSDQFEKNVTDISSEALQKLVFYDWPGNVRELEHTIERAVVLSKHAIIRSDDVILPVSKSSSGKESFQSVKREAIAQFEKKYIQGLLYTHQGNITKAAEAARKNRRAFWQLMRKYGIDARSFKYGRL
jgi:DNA-binding NtrC family response regulator